MRFPGFTERWETKKLGNVAKFSKGKGISKSDINANGITECIRYGELYTFYNEVIEDVNSKTNVDSTSLVLSEANDVIIPASGEARIDIAIASCVLKSGIALGGDLNIIKTKNNGVFLSYYLNSKKKIEIANLAQGVSVVHLYSNQLASLLVNLPKLEEQDRISTFLTLLDKRIQTQSKIIEGLKCLKQSVSKKIFSLEIRFPEFNKEWSVLKLKEVFSIPEKIKPDQIDKDKLITVKLHLKGVLKNDNSGTLSIGATNYFIRKKGQFIYGKQNLFNGAFGIIPEELDGYLSSGDIPTLDINQEKANPYYFLCFFSQPYFYKQLESISSGSGSKRIHESSLLNVKIPFPTILEQEKIAKTLSTLSEKLETEKAILEQLEKQKKYLLQQMFV